MSPQLIKLFRNIHLRGPSLADTREGVWITAVWILNPGALPILVSVSPSPIPCLFACFYEYVSYVGRAAARHNAPKQPRAIRVGPNQGGGNLGVQNIGGLSKIFKFFFSTGGFSNFFFQNTGGLSNFPPKILDFWRTLTKGLCLSLLSSNFSFYTIALINPRYWLIKIR